MSDITKSFKITIELPIQNFIVSDIKYIEGETIEDKIRTYIIDSLHSAANFGCTADIISEIDGREKWIIEEVPFVEN